MVHLKKITVKNTNGLHCRPCSEIVSAAKKFKSEIVLEINDKKANLKNMMELLILAIKKNDIVILKSSGEDSEEALSQMVILLEKEYDFKK